MYVTPSEISIFTKFKQSAKAQPSILVIVLGITIVFAQQCLNIEVYIVVTPFPTITSFKLGLYLKHIKNDNEESKLCSNYSSIRNNRFISSAKNIKNIKDSRNITFKKELSPINMNSTNDRYFLHSREQFVYNILKNKGKIDKLEINDFPVFNKYFNS